MDGVQAKEARRDREKALAQVEMAKALSTGISWGLSEDAAGSAGDDSDAGLGPGGTLDWRAYAESHVSGAAASPPDCSCLALRGLHQFVAGMMTGLAD